MHCTLHHTPCAVRRAPCAVRRAPCAVRRAPCAVRRAPGAGRRAPGAVRRATYTVRCTVYGVRCTVYGVRCTAYGVRHTAVHRTPYTVHCTLYAPVDFCTNRPRYRISSRLNQCEHGLQMCRMDIIVNEVGRDDMGDRSTFNCVHSTLINKFCTYRMTTMFYFPSAVVVIGWIFFFPPHDTAMKRTVAHV